MSKFARYASFTVFALSVYVFLRFIFVGLDHDLTEHHGFRQTQTAMTVYYLLKGGPWLAYETPLFGPPWTIPFEFPIYQWSVAILTFLTGMEIDTAGRLMSIVYFVLSLFPLNLILQHLRVPLPSRLLLISFVLASPMYLFWSRTFMIESCALFLGMSFAACVSQHFAQRKTSWLVAATIVGTIAAMTKITTFLSFACLAALFVIRNWIQVDKHSLSKATILHYGKYFLLLACVPFVAVSSWVHVSDMVKIGNPLVDFLLSKNLTNWNFGTLQQKLDWNTWKRIYDVHINEALGYKEVLLSVATLFLIGGTHRFYAFICFMLFVIPVSVFTNLYVVHDYYAYANCIFLLLGVGFLLIPKDEQQKTPWQPYALGLLFIGLEVLGYKERYNIGAKMDNNYAQMIGNEIAKRTREDQVVMFWGEDWSPALPYYAKRRAIMLRGRNNVNDADVATQLGKLEKGQLGAAVFCNDVDQNFVDKQLIDLRLSTDRVQSGHCMIYSTFASAESGSLAF